MYVYRKIKTDLCLNPEGIVCKTLKLHTIPSGLRKITDEYCYKHKFPSGMCNNL
jgi:hypothetical protein